MVSNEILLMAEVVSREKGLDKEVIFKAVEAALETASRKVVQKNIDIRIAIDRKTGERETFRRWEVVGDELDIESEDRQLTLAQAKEIDEALEIGDIVEEQLNNDEYGRISIQAAKQVILQKVREAEREKISDEFNAKLGELVLGTVKRVERDGLVVEVNGIETYLPRRRMIPRENLRKNDRVRALIHEVKTQPTKGPMVRLDRISPEFLIQLFRLEVPEAGEGLIEIVSAARDPGVRCKIAVHSKESSIDPIGACVGIRGARVQSVSNEIGGERVDIVLWSDDLAQYVINALSPAEVDSIIIDEEKNSIDVVVDPNQTSLAIGRGGQNVRLVADLVNWEINILTNEQAAEKIEKEESELRDSLISQLEIDEEVAEILVANGFSSIEEIAYVPKQELLDIEDFDEDIVDELRNRAEDAILIKSLTESTDTKMPEDLTDIKGMTDEILAVLTSNDVTTVDDLAEFATDELLELLPDLDEDSAKEMIMHARLPWFQDEQ